MLFDALLRIDDISKIIMEMMAMGSIQPLV